MSIWREWNQCASGCEVPPTASNMHLNVVIYDLKRVPNLASPLQCLVRPAGGGCAASVAANLLQRIFAAREPIQRRVGQTEHSTQRLQVVETTIGIQYNTVVPTPHSIMQLHPRGPSRHTPTGTHPSAPTECTRCCGSNLECALKKLAMHVDCTHVPGNIHPAPDPTPHLSACLTPFHPTLSTRPTLQQKAAQCCKLFVESKSMPFLTLLPPRFFLHGGQHQHQQLKESLLSRDNVSPSS